MRCTVTLVVRLVHSFFPAPMRRAELLLAVIIALLVAAGALLVIDSPVQQRRAERSEEFQRLVGGLGFGPALDLSRCPFSFDPRCGDHCAEEDGRLPGGERYCPHHAGSIFYYPPLDRSRSATSAGD